MKGSEPTHLELTEVRNRAEKIVREHGLESFPVDVLALARAKQIEVFPNPNTEEGVSGMLLRSGDTFAIVYATYLNNEGFERFSIAHELGHYFLPSHYDLRDPSGSQHFSKAGFFSVDRLEREADTFAGSLLMPEDLFRESMNDFELGLPAIESMATLCRTSLTATAIRYAELNERPVGVVVSTAGAVEWSCLSRSFYKAFSERGPARGTKVPQGTATASIACNPEKVARSTRVSRLGDLSDWSDSGGEREITEDVIGLGRYGRVLTVLSFQGDSECLVD